MQTKISIKSTRIREAKRKEHQRVRNLPESNDCSSKDKRSLLGQGSRSQHQYLQKEADLQSSAGISYDNSIVKK